MSQTLTKSQLFASARFYFVCFMLYAIVGWAYEVFLEVVIYRWGFSDRGVLFGPYCPVYGFGAMAFLLCLHKLMSKKSPRRFVFIKPLLIFLGCMLIATAIELATSYILEAITGSWPWQTYVDYKINFQGRIALSPSLRFGLGGTLFLYVLQPLFDKLRTKIGDYTMTLIFWGLFVIFTADCAATALSSIL